MKFGVKQLVILLRSCFCSKPGYGGVWWRRRGCCALDLTAGAFKDLGERVVNGLPAIVGVRCLACR